MDVNYWIDFIVSIIRKFKAIAGFQQTSNDKKSQNAFGNKNILRKILCYAVELSETETAKACRNVIKHKQPPKFWVDDGTQFLGAFKTLCNKRGIHLYSTFSQKMSAFAKRNIRLLRNSIYRYLEEKLTYSYINSLDQFVKTMNSRLNLITVPAPNKVTKKDVPRLNLYH